MKYATLHMGPNSGWYYELLDDKGLPSMDIENDRKTTVLLIDDEEPLLEVLGAALIDQGYHCLRASAAMGALKILDRTPEVDVIVSDIRMPGMDGIELLRKVRDRYSDRDWLQVIFITGHATIDSSVDALRLAANDFLHKPVQGQEFLSAVNKAALEAREQRVDTLWRQEGHERITRLTREVQKLGALLAALPSDAPFVTSSPKFEKTNLALSDQIPSSERMIDLLRIRDIRTRFFSGKLFVDPAWHMLMELMEHHLLNKQMTAFSLYVVSGVPTATASRRLDEMSAAGLVYRWIDPLDRRRQLVALTEETIVMMKNYLHELDQYINKSDT